jgi:Family of unknown function (DUF6308)
VQSMSGDDTTLRIDRLDGERLVLDGLGLARGFFLSDASSIAQGSYDSLAGHGEPNRITTADIQAINRTMRARSKHDWWKPVLEQELDWLAALSPELDLIDANEEEWQATDGERLAIAALTATIGPRRGPSVASKVLHLKRPRLFPVLDNFVAVMLGVNMPGDAPMERRIEIAASLMLHLHAQGRANLQAVQTIRATLSDEGIERPLVRILDAIVWFSHPAAGVPNAGREISVRLDRVRERPRSIYQVRGDRDQAAAPARAPSRTRYTPEGSARSIAPNRVLYLRLGRRTRWVHSFGLRRPA